MEGENNSQPNHMVHTASGGVTGLLSRRHHFTKEIMEVSLPHTWKSPTIDKYDDSGNPNEHVYAYVTLVSLYMANNALLCRVFPTSLKGTSLN